MLFCIKFIFICDLFYPYQGLLKSSVKKHGFTPKEGITLGSVRVLGVSAKPTTVVVNGKQMQFDYNSNTGVSIPANLDIVQGQFLCTLR